jgi:hypothetical protein
LVVEAVKVTFVPGQIEVADALIETDGAKGVVTFIVMVLLEAIGPVTQGVLLVTTQYTVFPFNREELL